MLILTHIINLKSLPPRVNLKLSTLLGWEGEGDLTPHSSPHYVSIAAGRLLGPDKDGYFY